VPLEPGEVGIEEYFGFGGKGENRDTGLQDVETRAQKRPAVNAIQRVQAGKVRIGIHPIGNPGKTFVAGEKVLKYGGPGSGAPHDEDGFYVHDAFPNLFPQIRDMSFRIIRPLSALMDSTSPLSAGLISMECNAFNLDGHGCHRPL